MADEPASTQSTPPASSPPSQPVPSPIPEPSAPSTISERPGGITILAILYGLYGAVVLIGGLLLFLFGSAIAVGFARYFVPILIGGIAGIIGVFLIIIGLIILIITWGLWNLKEWAWLIAVVFAVIGLLHWPIGTILNIIVLWYLFKAEVKVAFKRG